MFRLQQKQQDGSDVTFSKHFLRTFKTIRTSEETQYMVISRRVLISTSHMHHLIAVSTMNRLIILIYRAVAGSYVPI